MNQREIKFRVWDGSKMREPSEEEAINTKGEILSLEDDKGFIPLNSAQRTYWNFKLLQFTGLKDKNGKDIYEGDIVKSNFGVFQQEPKEITFHLGAFCFKGNERDKIYYDQEDYNKGTNTNSLEVIGNIYENPELLK